MPQKLLKINIFFCFYIILFILLLLCYGNTFSADWHFDDIANILLNVPLHIDNLNPATLKQTFFAYPEQSGKLLRPISNLSFALNWFIGQDRVFGYHAVNFIIHFLTSIILFHSCLLLLQTPAVRKRYKIIADNFRSKVFIAGLAAILWAVNPVQTQAITYIVQRMASLAAMFYIAGILSYLKARLSQGTIEKVIVWHAFTVLFYLLAVGSKENAVLLPASILLIEIIFFRQQVPFNKKNVFFFSAGVLVVFGMALLLAGPDFFLNLFSSYENRNFTLYQRLLTESRIIVYYISLLFYPAPYRLCITHDVQLSTSLFSPPTTFASIIFLTICTILPLIYYKRYPLLSFAILFFLLNHVVESTIIPLELVFEHRNYLPSFFLFLPISAAIETTQIKFHKRNKIIYGLTTILVAVLIIFLTLGSNYRNNTWKTEKSLWADSLKKAPRSARSYINLASSYFFQDKNYQKAFALYYSSLDKQSPTPWKDRVRAYNAMGLIMSRIGNYQKAFIFYNKALTIAKTGHLKSIVALHKAQTLWRSGDTDLAIKTATDLVLDDPNKVIFLRTYAEMLISSEQLLKGLNVLHIALQKSSPQSTEYRMILLDLSLAFGRLESPDKSLFFALFAQQLNAPFIPTSLCILENSLRAKQLTKAEQTLKILLSELSWPEFIAIIKQESSTHNFQTLPLNYPLLQQYVTRWLNMQKTQ